jgi:hypothetical protein
MGSLTKAKDVVDASLCAAAISIVPEQQDEVKNADEELDCAKSEVEE